MTVRPPASFSPYPARLLILLGALLVLSTCRRNDADDVAPVVRFSFPAEFTILSGLETVRVIANDNDDIAELAFLADGILVETFKSAPFTLIWNTTAYPDCTIGTSYITLTALAKDPAGNQGSASRRFYVDNEGLPPLPVEILPSFEATKHAISLEWEQSVEYDFSHYILRRDTSADVTASSDSLAGSTDPDSTTYTDVGAGVTAWGLDEDTDYRYRVYVYDTFGRSAGSDSVTSIKTLLPTPVRISGAASVSKYTATLVWNDSDEDVVYYRLHRGLTSAETDLDSIAGLAPGVTNYTDTSLNAKTGYYYYLFLIDSAGYTHNFTLDDVLQVTTDSIDVPRLAQTAPAVGKYTATIQWVPVPVQEDSSWISIYRDNSGTVDGTSDLIMTIPVGGLGVTFADAQLTQGSTYQYRMQHVDSRNNFAWSNTIELTTRRIADVWLGALGVSNQGKYDLTLGWDPYTYNPDDFAGYSLSRINTGEIYATTVASNVNFTDTGLQRKKTYTYDLVVADTSGATVSATLQATTRDIFPAEITLVEPTVLWFFKLEWLPSPEEEFDHYAVVRSLDGNETFADEDGDDVADCVTSGACAEAGVELNRLPSDGNSVITFEDNDPNLIPANLTDLPVLTYAVLTYDNIGGYSASNIVGDTLYAPPEPVTVSVDSTTNSTISLSWTPANWPSNLVPVLFLRYELWRNTVGGELPGDPGSSYIMWQTFADSVDNTSFTDTGSDWADGQSFAYRVILVDRVGQSAISAEVIGTAVP